MKVLLVYLCQYEDRNDYYISLVPYGLLSIAAYLQRHKINAAISNYSYIGYKKALSEIIWEKPDVLCFSIFTFNRVDTLELIRLVKLKNPKIIIVAGGPHATHLSGEIAKRYPEIDHIIEGEGEEALLGLLTDLRNKKNPGRIISGGRIEKLDELPFASGFSGRMHGINTSEQYKYIITTRGCPNKCVYCCSPSFWQRKAGFRSAENIVDEIIQVHKKFGIIYFSIRDDNFTLKKDRVLKFSRLLRKSGLYIMWNCQARVDTIDREMLAEMKLSGLEHIQYGVESGSEKMLKLYDKSITPDKILKAAKITREVGVYLSVYLMTGMEGEDPSDVEKTKSLIKKILPGDGIVSPVAYYPGTELYESGKRKKVIADDVWFKNHTPGIYLRNDSTVKVWMNELLKELNAIRSKSWYTAKDFAFHRKITGDDCWVTDILEGDYYLDEEKHSEAETCYSRVIKRYPANLWGYLRMGKLKFFMDDFADAETNYRTVTVLAPMFFGGWLKLAQSQAASGKWDQARKSAQKASDLNPYDAGVKHMMKSIHPNNTSRRKSRTSR
jgi:anaerobic magnesium-protoporphyrin IX monomethyl ester cyclase